MSEITQKQTFEEKMMGRIRDSIGDLLSDEDLKKIVERGVEKALFTGRETGDTWNRRTEPCLVDKAVREFLEKRTVAAVDEWIAANPERLQAAVENAIKTGIAGCVMQTLDQKFQWMLSNMVEQMKSQGMLVSR